MNVPADVAKQVIDTMRATPFVLALLVLNTIALAGFAYSLHEISKAADRRDGLLEKCMSIKN
jgi:predicted aspartyl protease